MYTPSACHHTRQPFLESNGCSPNLAVFLYFAQIIETIYNEDVLDVECESNNDGHDDGDVHISGQLETSVMSQEEDNVPTISGSASHGKDRKREEMELWSTSWNQL